MVFWRIAAFVCGGLAAYGAWLAVAGGYGRAGWLSRLIRRCVVGCAGTVPAVAVLGLAGAWPDAGWSSLLVGGLVSGLIIGVIAPVVARVGPLP